MPLFQWLLRVSPLATDRGAARLIEVLFARPHDAAKESGEENSQQSAIWQAATDPEGQESDEADAEQEQLDEIRCVLQPIFN